MSKSLKNFTTIREALERGDWTPRALRIVFLLGGWKEGIEITDDLVKAGSAWEDKVNNFFINVNDLLERQADNSPSGDRIDSQKLAEALGKAQLETYNALCDSFNTPSAMTKISELISTYNTADKSQRDEQRTKDVAKWVTSMVNIFGLNGSASAADSTIGWSGISIPEAAVPFIYPLSEVRDELRRKTRSAKGITPTDINTQQLHELLSTHNEAEPYTSIVSNFVKEIDALAASNTNISRDILQRCDRLRDVDLWNHGIYLEDREGDQPALVRLVSRELLAARHEKEDRERQKQKAKVDREKEVAFKAEKGSLSHLDMFRTKEYSAWDADGLPTMDASGEEITKSRSKKLRKDWERQKKLHDAWSKSQSIVT
ncbi:MAG: hypothetical protein Q9187_008887 [Circinaria calcarea]